MQRLLLRVLRVAQDVSAAFAIPRQAMLDRDELFP